MKSKGEKIVSDWNKKHGLRMWSRKDANRLLYVRECLRLSGCDEAAPIEAVARSVVKRLINAESKLNKITKIITTAEHGGKVG